MLALIFRSSKSSELVRILELLQLFLTQIPGVTTGGYSPSLVSKKTVKEITSFVLGHRHSRKLMPKAAAHRFTYSSFTGELAITEGLKSHIKSVKAHVHIHTRVNITASI